MTAIHNMKLKPEPFSMIETGKKTIELRLNDEKRQKIKVGDKIIFTLSNSENEKLNCVVTALHRFSSFRELYEKLDLLKCGYTKADIDRADYRDMNKYYSPEKQELYGVIGIEVRLI